MQVTLDDFATRLICFKARQLVGRYGFTPSDCEDIQQELTLNLLTRLDRFDPARGRPATFVRMLVDRGVASLVRERTARARDFRRAPISLDRLRDDGCRGLAEPVVDRRRQADLALDLAEALEQMPDELRTTAMQLPDSTLSEAARQRGCGRERIRRHVQRLRQELSRRKVDQYTHPRCNGVSNQMGKSGDKA